MKSLFTSLSLSLSGLVLLMVCSTSVLAQAGLHEMCPVTDADIGPSVVFPYTGETPDAYFNDLTPKVYKIHFWIMVEDNDITDIYHPNFPSARYDELLEAVANLNRAYNKFRIYFKFNGYSVKNDTSLALLINDQGTHNSCTMAAYPGYNYYRNAVETINNNANNPDYVKPNSFNIYVMKRGACFGGVRLSETRSYTKRNGLNGSNIVHEVGHQFKLRHTWSNAHTSSCEQVTRDASNPCTEPTQIGCFNADTNGDLVVDTAAVPEFGLAAYPENTYDSPPSCEYTGSGKDCKDANYEIFYEDIVNAMGSSYACSSTYLTNGQGRRMRDQIPGNTNYAAAETDVSALYEPYYGTYYYSGPYTPENTVLFQPGFDYLFVRCYGDYDQPSAYGDTSFSYNINDVLLQISKHDTNYGAITHPNRTAIRIPQLDGLATTPPRRCYNNDNGFASMGKLYHFPDGYLNTNYSVTPQDSTQINNPQLINTLENGLYKIEKQYPDGSQTETVVLKQSGSHD